MKITLTLDVPDPKEHRMVYPRVAGALIDYAAAVVRNNQAMLRTEGPTAKAPQFEGDPAVGFGVGGRITTAHGVTVYEAKLEHETVDPDTDKVPRT